MAPDQPARFLRERHQVGSRQENVISEWAKAIDKVFAARHLSKGGPALWGYAAFGFEDVMFVDVEAILQNGRRSLNRMLVIKNKDGKWYAHPAPETESLLSAGLNDEATSTQDFSDAYEIQK